MTKLLEVLKQRDHLTTEQAKKLIDEAKEALNSYLAEGDMETADTICEDFFGLEPDYIFDLI